MRLSVDAAILSLPLCYAFYRAMSLRRYLYAACLRHATKSCHDVAMRFDAATCAPLTARCLRYAPLYMPPCFRLWLPPAFARLLQRGDYMRVHTRRYGTLRMALCAFTTFILDAITIRNTAIRRELPRR